MFINSVRRNNNSAIVPVCVLCLRSVHHVNLAVIPTSPQTPYLHLATSEMWCWCGLWKKGAAILCTIYNGAQWYEQFLSVSGCDLAWFNYICLPSASVSSVFLVLYILKIKFHILISWAWWDWPLRPGWLTIVLHWLDYLAGKIFLEMTCIKWDGKLYYSQHQLTFPISAMFSVVAPFSHPCTNIVILATLKLWSNDWLIDWLIKTTDNE